MVFGLRGPLTAGWVVTSGRTGEDARGRGTRAQRTQEARVAQIQRERRGGRGNERCQAGGSTPPILRSGRSCAHAVNRFNDGRHDDPPLLPRGRARVAALLSPHGARRERGPIILRSRSRPGGGVHDFVRGGSGSGAATTLVAEHAHGVAGFATLESGGYLDLLFVDRRTSATASRRGLLAAADRPPHSMGCGASRPRQHHHARPFFERRGFASCASKSRAARGEIRQLPDVREL